MVDDQSLREMSCKLKAEPDDFIHSFRQNLFMYIEHKHITLNEVAELADIPVSSLKTFMYGDSKDCHLSNAVKLAKVFHVSVDELVGCGTISPQTCNTLQTIRQLPASFTHFIRWATHYHYEMLKSEKVSKRAIEVMLAECGDNGNLQMTTNYDIMDISDLNDDIRPKIFMGIRIPCEHYEPHYYQDSILLLANDRNARQTENVVVSTGDCMWILKRREEIEDGKKVVNYYSIRDGRKRATENEIKLVMGYVVKVVNR